MKHCGRGTDVGTGPQQIQPEFQGGFHPVTGFVETRLNGVRPHLRTDGTIVFCFFTCFPPLQVLNMTHLVCFLLIRESACVYK